jgi:hypothetical protein
VLEVLDAHGAGDVPGQPFCDRRPEVRVLAAPEEKGGALEAAQGRHGIHRHAVVVGIELPAKEAA